MSDVVLLPAHSTQTLYDAVNRLTAERDSLRSAISSALAERDAAVGERAIRDRHPMAPERCPVCEWVNTNLMNYGEPGRSNWMCHGCAARAIDERTSLTADRDSWRARADELSAALSVCENVIGYALSDWDSDGTTYKVYRDEVPSLFTDEDGRALYANEGARRLLAAISRLLASEAGK